MSTGMAAARSHPSVALAPTSMRVGAGSGQIAVQGPARSRCADPPAGTGPWDGLL